MTTVPMHPALVHLPLGLAVLLPLLALGFTLALWRGRLPARAWAAVVGVQVLMVGGGLLALRTGEADEEQVEQRVGEAALERHEEAAEAFVWSAGALLALSLGVLALRSPRLQQWGRAGVTLGSVAVLALALQTGKAGGELVYVHGAAGAVQPPVPRRRPRPIPHPRPEGEGTRLRSASLRSSSTLTGKRPSRKASARCSAPRGASEKKAASAGTCCSSTCSAAVKPTTPSSCRLLKAPTSHRSRRSLRAAKARKSWQNTSTVKASVRASSSGRCAAAHA